MSPTVSAGPIPSPIDDDDVNATIDGQLLSHLVGEVTEVDMDETELGSFDDLYATGRRSKSTKNKKNKAARKSTKKSKSPTVSR